jgi:hypothetical protein
MAHRVFFLRAVDLERSQGSHLDQPGIARRTIHSAQARLVNRMHAEHPKFITEWAGGGIMPGNTEFMATGYFEVN